MSNQRTLAKFLLFVSIQKTKIDEIYNLLLEISLHMEDYIMTDQENFMQQPMRKTVDNFKKLDDIHSNVISIHQYS